MKTYQLSIASTISIAFFEVKVPAGFPSPAEPYVADYLDFNRYLVQNPSATFAVRCNADAMLEAGIGHNDVLVVNRSLSPKNNQVILINTGAEFLVRRCAITVLIVNKKSHSIIITKPLRKKYWKPMKRAILWSLVWLPLF